MYKIHNRYALYDLTKGGTVITIRGDLEIVFLVEDLEKITATEYHEFRDKTACLFYNSPMTYVDEGILVTKNLNCPRGSKTVRFPDYDGVLVGVAPIELTAKHNSFSVH